jgi:hypothetical protein
MVRAPTRAHASSHFFAVAIPWRRASASRSAMLRGALFDTWWHRTPACSLRAANRSSHVRPEVTAGSNS